MKREKIRENQSVFQIAIECSRNKMCSAQTTGLINLADDE